jgi:hypothetical protein
MDMEVHRPTPRMALVLHTLLLAARALLVLAARVLRLIVFAVLSTLEPLVRIALSLLAIGGFLTCFLYRFVVHAPHFPFALTFTLSVAVCVLLVLYSFAMRAFSP